MLTPNLSIYQHRSTNPVILPVRSGDPQPGTPGGRAVYRPLVTPRDSLCPKSPKPAQTLGYGKYALMRQAGQITDRPAIAQCSTKPVYGKTASSEYIPQVKNSAAWKGLALCGNNNICPTCAELRAKHNTELLNWALFEAKKRGYIPFLVTGTLKHSRSESLQSLLDHLSTAWANTHKRRAWRELKKIIQYLGTVTAIETTWGKANGWHPHIHALIFIKDTGKAGNARIAALITEYYRSQWRRESELLGRPLPSDEHGITVVHGQSAGAYIAKMGLSSELTSAVTKTGREGRYTPWQLLKESMPNSPESKVYASRFREYADAFRGRLTLRWTPGLRDALGVADEDKMPQSEKEKENEPVELYRYTPMEMRAVCARHAHQRILDVINNVQQKTNSNTELIKTALNYEVALIVHEYTSGFREKAGLRPQTFEIGQMPQIPGYGTE